MALIKRIIQVLSFSGATVPVGYTPIKEGRAEVTIGADTVQVPLVVSVDEAGNPITPLSDAQLRAQPLPVSGPLTDAQLRASPVPTTLDSLPAFATTPTVNLGTLGGAATDATLQQIKSAIQAQIDISSTLWTDNTGAYFVRKDNVNQTTGSITVTFSDPQGSAATPGAGLRPISAIDAEVVQTVYDATAAGTGYSAGDVLINVSIINTSASTPTASFLWITRTTQTALTTAPSLVNLIEHKQSVNIAGTVPVTMASAPAGAATDAALSAINTTLANINLNLVRQNLMFASLTGQTHLVDPSISAI